MFLEVCARSKYLRKGGRPATSPVSCASPTFPGRLRFLSCLGRSFSRPPRRGSTSHNFSKVFQGWPVALGEEGALRVVILDETPICEGDLVLRCLCDFASSFAVCGFQGCLSDGLDDGRLLVDDVPSSLLSRVDVAPSRDACFLDVSSHISHLLRRLGRD